MCTPLWGAHEALAFGGNVGIGCQRPATSHPICHRRPARRLLMFRRPHPAITGANWGGIYFGFNLGYGSARAFGAIPSIPAGRPAISTCGAFSPASRSAQISRPTRLCLAPRRISTAPGSMARSPAHFVVGTQCETKNFWFSTLRGRLGYAADRVLFYGTAGGALGDVALGQGGSFQHIVKGGWTAGAGVEAAFTART